MLVNIVKNGKLNYEFPSIQKIRNKTMKNQACVHPTYKRHINPHVYKVSISKSLKELKKNLIEKYK
jgi:nicotinate phosphoribosyltransferase